MAERRPRRDFFTPLRGSDSVNRRALKREQQALLRAERFSRRSVRNLDADFAEAALEGPPPLEIPVTMYPYRLEDELRRAPYYVNRAAPVGERAFRPQAIPGGPPAIGAGGDGQHPGARFLGDMPSAVKNTIKAASVLRGVKDVYDLVRDGYSAEKGDTALHDARLKQVRTDRLNDRISQSQAKSMIDDANLRLMGSSVKRLAQRAPGIAANAAFGYNPVTAGVDLAYNAPSVYSTIKSGIQYLGSKMGADPGGLPDSKQFFDYAKQRFTVGTRYGVLGRRVEDDGRKPRVAKCRGGIC